MNTIHKYPIKIQDRQDVQMPTGAQILCVQVQHGQPCIWAKVDTSMPMERRTIFIYGAGHPLPDDIPDESQHYLGTIQMRDGALVWHVFEP